MPAVNETSRYSSLRQDDQGHEMTQSDQRDHAHGRSRTNASSPGDIVEPDVSFEEVSNQAKRKRNHTRRFQARQPGRLIVWRYELACCVLFLAAFCAIVATLLPFEHRELPQWKYGLSLNSVVSIYVVILRASMLLVASQCLSQLKWLWFRDEHKLLDIASYDDASRGPLGSLKFLWKLRGQDLIASLGAFITVAALIIDPFAQQVVSSYSCVVEMAGTTASLNRANSYILLFYGGAAGTALDLPMQKAINAGIYNPGLSPPFECKSGNCTFDTPYHTIGYCSSCTDLTSQLVSSVQNRTKVNATRPSLVDTVTLPPEYPGDPRASYAYLATNESSLPFSLVRGHDIVAAFTSNSTDLRGVLQPSRLTKVLGARCSLSPCIRTYTANVTDSTLNEKIVSTTPLGDGLSVDKECLAPLTMSQIRALGIQEVGNEWPVVSNVSFTANGSYYFVHNGSYYAPDPAVLPSRCIYGVNYQAVSALANFLSTFLNGNITCSGSNLWNAYGPAPVLTIYNMSWVTFDDVEETFRNISDSITTQIRVYNSQGYHDGAGIASEPVFGRTWENTVCVHVRWAFLVYPAVVVALAVVFLATTISHQRRDIAMTWKSSQLALIFHGLRQDTVRDIDRDNDLQTVRDMELIAKSMSVSLRAEGSHLNLRSARE